MNHQLWARVATRVLAVSFVIAGVTACGERLSDVSSSSAPDVPVSPSAQLIGTPPANPTGDPPGTTPVASNTTEISKKEESVAKPQEGDNHSYSTLAKDTPQKAGNVDPQQGEGRKGDAAATPAEPAKEGAPK